ncbi:hypothetical protein K5688_001693 [Campylobacter lari]|nr:hypothetical protein [Campylobacter lari]
MIFYLDYNIYVYSFKDSSIEETISKLKDNSIRFVYSYAHVEEIYSAWKNNQRKYNIKEILKKISKITDNYVFLPSDKGVIGVFEKPIMRYKYACLIPTEEIVNSDGKFYHSVFKNCYKQLLKKDKKYINISNYNYDKIWELGEIKQHIAKINENMKKMNESECMKVLNRQISSDLKIEKGIYNKIKDNFVELEYVIEQLFHILNLYGYNADKEHNKVVSGIYDVAHAICATKSDKLFTTDKKFAKKCEAVYRYIGVSTEVACCPVEKISDCLISKLKTDF